MPSDNNGRVFCTKVILIPKQLLDSGKLNGWRENGSLEASLCKFAVKKKQNKTLFEYTNL